MQYKVILSIMLFLIASSAARAAGSFSSGGFSIVSPGPTHSVIETTTDDYARLWFKRRGVWIGSIGSTASGVLSITAGLSDGQDLTIKTTGEVTIHHLLQAPKGIATSCIGDCR